MNAKLLGADAGPVASLSLLCPVSATTTTYVRVSFINQYLAAEKIILRYILIFRSTAKMTQANAAFYTPSSFYYIS